MGLARKAPLRLVFPDFDPLGWSRGMRTSVAESVSIDTHVSQEFGNREGRVPETGGRRQLSLKGDLAWEPQTFIFRGYNP